MIRGFALRVALAGAFTIGLIHGHASLAQTAQDSVIAIVNGKTILTSDMTMFQNSLPENYRRVDINVLLPQLLEGLIDGRLLAQAALEAGMMDDPTVKRRLAYVTNDVLQQTYLDQLLAEEITEQRIRETYEATIPTQPGEEEISARHILLEDEGAARAVIGELDAGGDFAALAKTHSTGPSGAGGGDLGYFTRQQMVAAFAEAAFALNPGEYTKDPIKTQFGWHVIKVEDRRVTPPPTFEESQAEIGQQLAQEFVRDLMANLRDTAEISRFDLQGNPLEAPPAPAQ
ncbi:MAG: peptidylprolyl isomerase [Proteobacteria bacterium]|nr:peptidylprolyl isomerase [Pseudomonadota bacterium]